MEVLTIADDPVARVSAGPRELFDDLYRRHAGRVFAICLRLTGERARAEDLTQESFVRAWNGLASLRGDSNLAGWLARIAVNTVLSDRRSRARRGSRETPLDDLDALPRPRAVRPGDALDLEAAIAALPDGARTVFVLHDVEGYRHEEIAGLLGVATGTSKAQLHRARRLLREALRS